MRRGRAAAASVGLVALCGALAGSLASPAAAHHTLFNHGTVETPAPWDFAEDVPVLLDSEWGFPIGGFGGIERGAPLTRTPVIIVHGNTEDHTFFEANENPPTVVNVRQRFRDAGYSDQEVWALSYNGARCGNNDGCGTANDVNAPDLAAFIAMVLDYTGAAEFDLIGHSLGVTVARATMRDHPDLLARADDLVFASGANHGTTVCRGQQATSFGCDEIAPGTAWLAGLNEPDETPGGADYTTICDCTGAVDHFFLGPDAASPQLDGADNIELPGTAHFSTVRGLPAFEAYLARIDDGPPPTAEPEPSHVSDPSEGAEPGPGAAPTNLPTTGGGAGALAALLALLFGTRPARD